MSRIRLIHSYTPPGTGSGTGAVTRSTITFDSHEFKTGLERMFKLQSNERITAIHIHQDAITAQIEVVKPTAEYP